VGRDEEWEEAVMKVGRNGGGGWIGGGGRDVGNGGRKGGRVRGWGGGRTRRG